ncbi:hypothetical protein AB0C34_29475 [Nocardia sp. NPDC049220]|uniref:hypothetical protein n=1 Tax=Nocardia sp. NPDC049220 TaxID=3155273 RepID=UPI0033F9F874
MLFTDQVDVRSDLLLGRTWLRRAANPDGGTDGETVVPQRDVGVLPSESGVLGVRPVMARNSAAKATIQARAELSGVEYLRLAGALLGAEFGEGGEGGAGRVLCEDPPPVVGFDRDRDR